MFSVQISRTSIAFNRITTNNITLSKSNVNECKNGKKIAESIAPIRNTIVNLIYRISITNEIIIVIILAKN